MSDAFRRAVRTFFQGFVGVLALIAIPILNDMVSAVGDGNDVVLDVNIWQSVLMAAVAGGVISLISYVQNELEDKTKVPAPLKDKPVIDPMQPETWSSVPSSASDDSPRFQRAMDQARQSGGRHQID